MPTRAVDITLLLPPFLLVLFRITGLTLAAPLFSSAGVPARIKVAFAFVLALMVSPLVFPKTPRALALSDVVACVFGELMIGLILGMAVALIFLGGQLAGMIIGQQTGIALGRVVNPMLDEDTTIVGQLYFLVCLMVFFAVGGHRLMVSALLDTFWTIPPGSFRINSAILTLLATLLSSAFKLAMKLAAPALAALFMGSLTMGFLSRTIPQLNVLTIGFAIRVLVGLTVAALALPEAFDLVEDALTETMEQIQGMFGP